MIPQEWNSIWILFNTVTTKMKLKDSVMKWDGGYP